MHVDQFSTVPDRRLAMTKLGSERERGGEVTRAGRAGLGWHVLLC